MDGIGAASYNFPYGSDIGWTWSKVSWVYDDLKMSYIRTAPWFDSWEPSNDNTNPSVVNWAVLGTNGVTTFHDVAYAKFLKSKNIDVNPGIWTLPGWLRSPSNSDFVNSGLLPEVGESIASYLKNMANNAVPMNFAEVQNEPAIPATTQYPSPETLRDAGLQLISHLDALGLTSTMLHAPNYHTPPGTVAWAQVWFANKTLSDRTAAVSYHTWWSTTFADFDAIRKFAEGIGKPVWATEVGGFNALNIDQSSWATAFDYARGHFRALAWSHASRTYHWTLLGHDGALNPSTGSAYPGYYVLKHYANFIPKNSKMIFSQAGDAKILPTVFKHPNGDISAVILNDGTASKTLRITSASGAGLNLASKYTSSSGSYFVGGATSGQTTVVLPAQSITSVMISSQSAPDTVAPAPPTGLRITSP